MKLGNTTADAYALGYQAGERRIAELEKALDQLLDDMGDDGLCVCQYAKDQAIAAFAKARPKQEDAP